jgi:mannose-6-phosphate isomerase-like protein (cupin superfamily)
MQAPGKPGGQPGFSPVVRFASATVRHYLRTMTSPSNPDPLRPWREGDEWVNAATGLRLRVEEAAASTNGASITWIATYPPYSAEPPLHFHPRQTEHFEILAGTMRVNHLGATRDVAAGADLLINPGEPHAMWNPQREPAVVRWETTPALRSEQWMGMLIALAAAGRTKADGAPGFLQLALLLRTYHDEIRLARPAAWVQALILGPAPALARIKGLRADRL